MAFFTVFYVFSATSILSALFNVLTFNPVREWGWNDDGSWGFDITVATFIGLPVLSWCVAIVKLLDWVGVYFLPGNEDGGR